MTSGEVVSAFLGAYQRHDYHAMHACLDPDVEFCDLAFKKIAGDQVRAMWQWYCVRTPTRAEPIGVPGFETTSSNGETVNAEYWVRYMPAPGRHVNYVIRSEFTVRDGKIVRQVDEPVISNLEFARMAMGLPLCLLALTPFFKPLIRAKMLGKLADFANGANAAR
jgi:ketosteroid isomerase-like protein